MQEGATLGLEAGIAYGLGATALAPAAVTAIAAVTAEVIVAWAFGVMVEAPEASLTTTSSFGRCSNEGGVVRCFESSSPQLTGNIYVPAEQDILAFILRVWTKPLTRYWRPTT